MTFSTRNCDPLSPLAPKFPNFATQILLFRLTHTVVVVTPLGYWVLLTKKTTFRTKIGGGLGQGSIRKKFGTPYLFLQPTEKLVHNRFTLPNTSFRTKLGRVWIRRVPLSSPLWWCNCMALNPTKSVAILFGTPHTQKAQIFFRSEIL